MVEVFVNVTFAEGRHALAGMVKFGLGIGLTNTGMVRTVLLHPLLVVTDKVTL